MLITASLSGNSITPLCSFIFFHTSYFGAAFSFLYFSSFFGHFHFLCPSSLHWKHLTFSSTFSCFLTSLIPYCITQLFNTSNLFPTIVFFICFSPLLHFWAKCLNLLHCLHNLPSLPSNSALSLVRAHLLLSMSLMSLLYWSRNIMLCSEHIVLCKKKKLYFLKDSLYSSPILLVHLLGYKIFTQPDAYCLIDYCPNTRVDYHFMEEIPTVGSLLKSNYYSFT